MWKPLVLFVKLSCICAVISACQDESPQELKASEQEVSELEISDLKGKEFTGVGPSRLSGYQNEWRLILGVDNEVVLLKTWIGDQEVTNLNNQQMFGGLKKMDNGFFELETNFCLFASGCDKPRYEFLRSDSAAIHIDSIVLEELRGGHFLLESTLGYDSSFVVNDQKHIFRTILDNGQLDTSKFTISYIPKSGSRIQPFILRGGDRCGTYINDYKFSDQYLLKKTGDEIVLIVDCSSRYANNHIDTIMLRTK